MKLKPYVALTMGVLFSFNAWSQGSRAKTASKYTNTSTAVMEQQIPPLLPFLSIEPVVGYNSSTFAGVEGINGATIKPKGGLQGGIAVLMGRSQLQFETGLFYAKRGTIMEFTSTALPGASATMDFTLNYLDVPLMARYTTNLNSQLKFFAHGGAVMGFLQDSKIEVKASYLNASNSNSQSGSDYFHNFDPRLAVGIGGHVAISRSLTLTSSLDYQMSVSKINAGDFAKDEDIQNASAGLNLGLKLDI